MHLPLRFVPCAMAVALLSAGCVAVPPGSLPGASMTAPAGRAGTSPATASGPPLATELNATFRLGRQELIAGRTRSAIEHFAHVLDRDPQHVEALNALAVAVAELDRLPEAVALLRRAVALAPQAVHLRNNLGYALYRSGDVPQARAELRIALELQPSNALALRNLALLGQPAAPATAASPATPSTGQPEPVQVALPPTPPALPERTAGIQAVAPPLPPVTPERPAPMQMVNRPPAPPVAPARSSALPGVEPTVPAALPAPAGPVQATAPLAPPSDRSVRQALGLSDPPGAAEPRVAALPQQLPSTNESLPWSQASAEQRLVVRRSSRTTRLADPMLLRTLGLESDGLARAAAGALPQRPAAARPDRLLGPRPARGFEHAPYLIELRPARPAVPRQAVQG